MSDIRYRAVWQATDTAAQIGAMTFWTDNALLPPNANPMARTAQLCVLAEANGAVVGVSTAQVRSLEILRARLALYRCAVAPEFRRRGVATQLTVRSRQALEAWSVAHPDQQVQGMVCVVRGEALAAKRSQPLWPLSGLGLIGYEASGEQIRVAWFDHSLV
jgi:ribosomal protein S18 acetylase RimI-like enzyme